MIEFGFHGFNEPAVNLSGNPMKSTDNLRGFRI